MTLANYFTFARRFVNDLVNETIIGFHAIYSLYFQALRKVFTGQSSYEVTVSLTFNLYLVSVCDPEEVNITMKLSR